MKHLWILVPSYNEKDNVDNLIERIKEEIALIKKDFQYHVMYIDDNSPDGTADYVERLATENTLPNLEISVLRREKKEGLGKAYVAAFKYCLEKECDYVLQMDGDLSHNPKYIKDFLHSAEQFDFVIGSRYVSGGGVENWSFSRRFISKMGSICAFLILWIRINDYTGGYNLWSRKVLEQIGLNKIKNNGYAFQIEMKYRAAKMEFKYKEIPIIFPDRTKGKSKMSGAVFFEPFKKILQLRMELP